MLTGKSLIGKYSKTIPNLTDSSERFVVNMCPSHFDGSLGLYTHLIQLCSWEPRGPCRTWLRCRPPASWVHRVDHWYSNSDTGIRPCCNYHPPPEQRLKKCRYIHSRNFERHFESERDSHMALLKLKGQQWSIAGASPTQKSGESEQVFFAGEQ